MNADRTSHDAINQIGRQLSSRGFRIDEVREWSADLAEDGETIVVLAAVPGFTAVAGIDFPFGAASAQTICAEIERRNH